MCAEGALAVILEKTKQTKTGRGDTANVWLWSKFLGSFLSWSKRSPNLGLWLGGRTTRLSNSSGSRPGRPCWPPTLCCPSSTSWLWSVCCWECGCCSRCRAHRKWRWVWKEQLVSRLSLWPRRETEHQFKCSYWAIKTGSVTEERSAVSVCNEQVRSKYGWGTAYGTCQQLGQFVSSFLSWLLYYKIHLCVYMCILWIYAVYMLIYSFYLCMYKYMYTLCLCAYTHIWNTFYYTLEVITKLRVFVG